MWASADIRFIGCSGAGCTAFAKIGLPATTAYTDSGLTSSASYSYQVRATDVANISAILKYCLGFNV